MEAQLLTNTLPDDVSGWWVSEKYDGVRAIWTGSSLISRHGRPINAPSWFTDGLPKGARLDGELWMGRGTFDQLQSVMRSKAGDWTGVHYMVFDLAAPGSFEDRYRQLTSMDLGKYAHRARHTILRDSDELSRRESDIVSIGGEGLVIRRPGCKYRPGRCGDVIKVKRLVADLHRWQG